MCYSGVIWWDQAGLLSCFIPFMYCDISLLHIFPPLLLITSSLSQWVRQSTSMVILSGKRSPRNGFLSMHVLFGLLRRISVSHTVLNHLAVPPTQLPWTEMLFSAFRSHESFASTEHHYLPQWNRHILSVVSYEHAAYETKPPVIPPTYCPEDSVISWLTHFCVVDVLIGCGRVRFFIIFF